jgi:hypothetical protein
MSTKYQRRIVGLDPVALEKGIRKPIVVIVDVYNVLDAFSVSCPARAHAVKKHLCAGIRGKGPEEQDLSEAVICAERAVELHEDKKLLAPPAKKRSR